MSWAHNARLVMTPELDEDYFDSSITISKTKNRLVRVSLKSYPNKYGKNVYVYQKVFKFNQEKEQWIRYSQSSMSLVEFDKFVAMIPIINDQIRQINVPIEPVPKPVNDASFRETKFFGCGYTSFGEQRKNIETSEVSKKPKLTPIFFNDSPASPENMDSQRDYTYGFYSTGACKRKLTSQDESDLDSSWGNAAAAELKRLRTDDAN